MQMWPDLIAKSKEGGVDVIQTYVFWSGHEPVRGQVLQIFSEREIESNSSDKAFTHSIINCLYSTTLKGVMTSSSL